ncbi:BQ2448_6135 [Microbotryum intermedium]|uniref:BQ2448_6135 protein n=1 Tax=Microbotryum intermedium TaxID=269621 RepID=A0A238FKM3_9BASI|nr:BQ2448_6135 [Microbotryum intermedium]
MALILTSDHASSSSQLDAAQLSIDPSSTSPSHSGASSLAAPPLHTLLASNLNSANQLLHLLVPPLVQLGALPLELTSSLLAPTASSPSSSSSPSPATFKDPHKFIKRQLALVQKVLLERTWPDWEHALSIELEDSGLTARLFSSWFVPDLDKESSSFSDQIALSALQVLCSCLSTKRAQSVQRPLSPRSIELVVDLLSEWVDKFSLERVYRIIFAEDEMIQIREDRWERILKYWFGMPVLVANRMGELSAGKGAVGQNVPPSLEVNFQAKSLTRSFSELLHTVSKATDGQSYSVASLSTTLSTLLPLPDFAPTLLNSTVPHLLPPTAFPVAAELLLLRRRLARLWQETILEMSDRQVARFLRVTLFEIQKRLVDISDPSTRKMQRCHAGSWLLSELFGSLGPDQGALWRIAFEVLTDRANGWNGKEVEMARVVFGWVGSEEKSRVAALDKIMQPWCDASSIKAAVASNRIFLSTLLILSISSLPPSHPSLVAISRSTTFIQAISTHLSLLHHTVRLLGMLIAEIISAKALARGSEMKALTFGEEIWNGQGEGKDLCRMLRGIEVGTSEEIQGWQEESKSAFVEKMEVVTTAPLRVPTTPLPTPNVPTVKENKAPLISIIDADSSDSEFDPEELPRYPTPLKPSLATLKALHSPDPSLYATTIPSSASPSTSTRKRGDKLRPPVYVPELTAYLKGLDPEGRKEEVDQEAERVEVGLTEGEGLVRRKKGWGGELDENAVDLTFALMGLQDQYDIKGFEDSKRKIMIALVSSCPRTVAPCIIEQYFTPSYSVAQRYTMLTSLALGARELAGLSIEIKAGSLALAAQSASPQTGIFPSKQLPPAMHKRIVQASQPTPLDLWTEDVTRITLSSVREEAKTTIPEASVEKLVRVRRFASATTAPGTTPTTSSYTSLASDYFIMPLINRFWLYLRDVASMPITQQGPYAGGSGTAVLLNPLVLTQYLSTLALLLHAARLAPTFSDVLAPEALHLVLALRTSGGREEHPQVLEKEMSLILVVLDAIVAFDGGTGLMTRVEGGANLVGEVQGWATEVFERFDGREVGFGEGKAGRTAAGILLRIEEVLSRARGRLGW